MSYPLNKLSFIEKSETPPGFSVISPVSGDVSSLVEHNQPLVSSGILGEGVVVEVGGNKIVAPFDGVVSELPGSCHRIVLKAKSGIKLLILFTGQIDQLMGLGFTRHVSEQQSVSKGQTLLGFNLQQLQRLDNPCYCAVFITNPEQLGQMFCSVKKVTAGEDTLLTLTPKKKAEQA